MAAPIEWFIISADNWKPHAVPAVFADALIAEMHARGSKGEIVRRSIRSYGLDRGGMAHAKRPVERFPFQGLDFGVPSEHVKHFAERLAALEPRTFGERTYYKLHCHWSCIVLTASQRQQLLRALRCRIDKAEARAVAFYRDKKPSNQVLAEAAEKATGVKLPPAAFGPDRHARFRKAARA